MAIRSIVKLGNPQLAKPAAPVTEFGTSALFDILQDMEDTMRARGGVGIAAPQIACYQQIIMFGFEHNARYPDAEPVPFTILINPTFEPLAPEMSSGWEGCLSVPGLRGLVPRYEQIKYAGFDQYGNYFTRNASGFHARIIQHECDHLAGILFPLRIQDLRNFGFEDELKDIIWPHQQ